MAASRSLIAPTANPLLEKVLLDKLHRRGGAAGRLGELEPLAVRLGLMQNTLKPRLRDPQLMVFAADHGVAVDGLVGHDRPQTRDQVAQLLSARLPVAVFARIQQIGLTVVDAGVADELPAHEHLLVRKIAHGTRNARVATAMSVQQAHAALRAGMELGEALRGNAVICAGIGVGSHLSAAMVLARLTGSPVGELLHAGPAMAAQEHAHLYAVAQAADARHRKATEPVSVLAAFGGFEIAMMAGVMLVAASKRHLLMIDGMAACAALMLASRIAAAVTDYCVFCRSHGHHGLDRAMALFQASALLELGMQATDGTGAALAWPLVRSAAALLTEVADGDDAGPSQPMGITGAGAGG
ncbi:MAG: nicotinate-nucleotide--dimethylbenzimidazole phosphoribosyltransferase [Proteobacteria bacterium]|nr:nicotinate-nucleotide--dimethylbenzimidazole phosphoribosyltransferase [Pseudomonadota bacterium]